MRVFRFSLCAAVVLSLLSCAGPSRVSYTTWEANGESPPKTLPSARESEPPSGAFPLGATVSHHLLAASCIDDTFRVLRSLRSVDTFIIISPLHFGQGYERISLSNRPWRTGNGMVYVDERLVGSIARRLHVLPDPTAFLGEHGVGTLIPFIARYFPDARVVPIACRAAPETGSGLTRELSTVLLPLFRGKGARRYLLLISADFSHHGDAAATEARDALSQRFFDNPVPGTAALAGSDNPVGMALLAELARSCQCAAGVLYHTNALRLAPESVDPADITSYFFSIIYQPKR